MNTPLDELQWKSPEWIQAFGLRTDNVLDYFAESPFFNKTSNNQVIKMQRQFSQVPGEPVQTQEGKPRPNDLEVIGAGPGQQQDQDEFAYADPVRRSLLARYPVHAMLERELARMKGIEYVLAYVREPDFWVVKKQERLAAQRIRVLQDYYIIGANVYQSPTVFKIVQSRVMSASYHLSETLGQLHSLTQFQPSQGVRFKRLQNTTSANPGAANGATGSQDSAPATATANELPSTTNTGQTAQTARTDQLDNNGASASRDVLTPEMMQKLMYISARSTPEYV
ncbi:hypothetical protein HG536_0E03150 [Torulaspora globosa]|uniref:Mediator of RNA polymerase II transcription subunit 6 n=1 Tax=Torulaspora globosa TaxID=48254 RepID=A0A7G3ZIR8_9SACH|nr:uncharacterized protein HG536_0E03150 [Torulaspora globosa]QLL33404.1 hypothetical protein HG536_0E03150 [Torulaspora globosa]